METEKNKYEEIIAGHDAWMELAVPPTGVAFAREDHFLPVEEFRSLLGRCDLNRPTDNLQRLGLMIANCSVLVTARNEEGRLIGIARTLSDFSYCSYLSDLCVDEKWQGRGIGRALIAETKRIVGPGSMLLLLSAPKSMGYYPHMGMETVSNGFIIRRDT